MNKQFHLNTSINIPHWCFDITYNPKVFPNWEKHDLVKNWANCQVYAYELLRFNGKIVPDLRSSELWEDTEYSKIVSDYDPLDILFFNNTDTSWWAHLWVYIWNNKVLHNSKKIWKPEMWDLDDFKKNEEYKVLLWWKRFIKNNIANPQKK